jgi:hypothetical protein
VSLRNRAGRAIITVAFKYFDALLKGTHRVFEEPPEGLAEAVSRT